MRNVIVASITIDKQSSYTITEAYLSEVGNRTWGAELLAGDVIFPGEQLEVRYVDCGTYDALIYDEFGVECQLNNIDLCFDDAVWVVSNSTFSTCSF